MSSSSAVARPRASARPVVVVGAVVVDVLLVLLFVAIGRRSHDEDSALIGFATTAWPFLVGAGLGWAASLGWRRPRAVRPVAVRPLAVWPLAVWPTGVVVWVGAVVVGMLLRVVSGQGVQPSFVIVTAVVLGAFLVGWRALAALMRRLRASRRR